MFDQKDIEALSAAIKALRTAHQTVAWDALPLQHSLKDMSENLASDLNGLLLLNAELQAA